jgi:Pectate lyase superfamily protein
MPVLVIPTGTITGQIVNTLGQPVAGLPVVAKLNAGVSTPQTIAPVGQPVPGEVSAFTDPTGAWSLALIPNNNITPANTTYTIQIPGMPDVVVQLNDTASHPYLSVAVNPTSAVLTQAGQTISGPLVLNGTLQIVGGILGPDPWFDVKAYGAVGDNSTDDTAAIQAAINAANAISTGGKAVVYFPPGTYVCTGTLTPGSPSQIWQAAGGRSSGANTATLLRYTGTGARFIDARNTTGFQLRDMFIQGNNAAFAGTLVDISGTTAVSEIRNCRLGLVAQAAGSILVNWDGAASQSHRMVGCSLGRAETQLQLGTASNINQCAVRDTRFDVNAVGIVPVKGKVSGFVMSGCLVELLGLAISATLVEFQAGSAGVHVDGLSLLDAGAGSTFIGVSFTGKGFKLTASVIGGQAGTTSVNIGNNSQGIDIDGSNDFIGGGTAVAFGTGINGAVLGTFASTATARSSGTPVGGTQLSPLGGTIYSGTGVPPAGLGANGDFYFRYDTPGTANQRIYQKSAGAWVALVV